jgi:hypothetical protein
MGPIANLYLKIVNPILPSMSNYSRKRQKSIFKSKQAEKNLAQIIN